MSRNRKAFSGRLELEPPRRSFRRCFDSTRENLDPRFVATKGSNKEDQTGRFGFLKAGGILCETNANTT